MAAPIPREPPVTRAVRLASERLTPEGRADTVEAVAEYAGAAVEVSDLFCIPSFCTRSFCTPAELADI